MTIIYGNPGVWRKDIAGENKGYGVYRKNGRLTYKGTPKKKPGPKSTKPVTKSAPVGKPAKSPLQQQIDVLNSQRDRSIADITGYQKAFGGLLAGMAPQVQAAYGDAGKSIADYGRGTYEGLRGLLGQAAGEAQGQFDATTGNNLPEVSQPGAEYNADAAADIGYSLGAYLPAKSLEEQGAAFGAAAAMGPKMAYQQGLYAIRGVQQETIESIAKIQSEAAAQGGDMPKASASLSKMMGMLVDVYGAPILDAKGKPIPVKTGQELTAYQAAQIGLAEKRLEVSAYSAESAAAARGANLKFRNSSEQRQWAKFERDGAKIDVEASRQVGHIVLVNGSEPKTQNGKFFPYKPKKTAGRTATPLSVKDRAKFRGQALTGAKAAMTGLWADEDGGPVVQHDPMTFTEALEEAVGNGIPENIARNAIASVYLRGLPPASIRRWRKAGWPIEIIAAAKTNSLIARALKSRKKVTQADIAWAQNVIDQGLQDPRG